MVMVSPAFGLSVPLPGEIIVFVTPILLELRLNRVEKSRLKIVETDRIEKWKRESLIEKVEIGRKVTTKKALQWIQIQDGRNPTLFARHHP